MTFDSPILALSRSLCHASFGGGGEGVGLRVEELGVEELSVDVARSGRCVRINHGRTPAYAEATAGMRTCFAQARPDFERRKRKRRTSVFFCGFQERI